jgi:peptide deformylase
MAILPIVKVPDPRLRQTSSPVEKVDTEVRALVADMFETMYAAPGIGLAAPQIGDPRRIIVIDVAHDEDDEPKRPLRMANPEILWHSEDETTYNEGCLSLPDHYADVTRPKEIRVRYLDDQNEIREMHADGLLATVIQHEIDHLQGVLFVDHISPLKRNIILRKLTKLKRTGKVPEPA